MQYDGRWGGFPFLCAYVMVVLLVAYEERSAHMKASNA